MYICRYVLLVRKECFATYRYGYMFLTEPPLFTSGHILEVTQKMIFASSKISM